MSKILSNSAKCLKCGDTIYSAHRHDHKSCSCGSIFVDGGMEYLRHGYDKKENYENISIEVPDSVFEACKDALEWCDDNKRNNTGRICHMFIALRDSGFLELLDEK